jgi:archaellum component FlaC
MKRFFSNVAGAGGFSVAAAVLVVGLVAAVSSAQQDTSPSVRTDAVTVTTDSVPDDAGDEVAPPGTDTPTTPEERLDLIESRLDQLDEFTSDLSDRSDDQDAITDKLGSTVDVLRSDVDDLRGGIKSMKSEISSLGSQLSELSSAVDALTGKTSKLNADGTYTGAVDPSQLTRRLTPTDISGQWPLDRTTGSLDIGKLGTPTFGCSGDSRYNVFVSVDVFGRYACIKVLK